MAIDLAPVEQIGLLFDLLGVALIVAAALLTALRSWRTWRLQGGARAYLVARRSFGQGLLLGLEVLIAADLMRTVAVNLSLNSVAALGLLVLIRTVLSFSVEVEIEGNLPWRLNRAGDAGDPLAAERRSQG